MCTPPETCRNLNGDIEIYGDRIFSVRKDFRYKILYFFEGHIKIHDIPALEIPIHVLNIRFIETQYFQMNQNIYFLYYLYLRFKI